MKPIVTTNAGIWLATSRLITLQLPDFLIIILYFVAVLGIGFYLKRFANTSNDFFRPVARYRRGWQGSVFCRPISVLSS